MSGYPTLATATAGQYSVLAVPCMDVSEGGATDISVACEHACRGVGSWRATTDVCMPRRTCPPSPLASVLAAYLLLT